MAFKLFMHPLSSYCHKALIGLYETELPFESVVVDLQNEAERAALVKLWPMGKFPVLQNADRSMTLAESTTILEYLAEHHRSKVALIPRDPEIAREVRFRDRFMDLYVHTPVQQIVGDRLRPAGQKDPVGVERSRATMTTAFEVLEAELSKHTWAVGEAFSMADCSAAPAIFYADKLMPLGDRYPSLRAYFDRLLARPSYARVLREAEPYFAMFPG